MNKIRQKTQVVCRIISRLALPEQADQMLLRSSSDGR